jgi:hypothetical protein
MMIVRAAAFLAVALAATGAAAIEPAQWPPPTEVESRMRELQGVLGSRESTPAQRESAREELSGLLKSPAGQARGRTPGEKPTRPARAAIEPFPSVVKPAYSPRVGPAPPLAQVEILDPPRPLSLPGALPSPYGRFAIDPRTGSVLHEIPGGYVNPRTGQVTPR